MPDCKACSWLEDKKCRAHSFAQKQYDRPLPPPPLGACVYAINEEYIEKIKPNMRVLEIGCGSWSNIKIACQKIGAHYEGVDTIEEYYGKKTVATKIENLAELSFDNDTFDLVIGNQTIEHWGEHGCPTSWGLYQIFRVLKMNGTVMLNAPIHFHGTSPFLLGDFQKIQNLFNEFSSEIILKKWGENPEPHHPFHLYKNYWPLRGKQAFIVDIQAVKTKNLKFKKKPLLLIDNKFFRSLHYPFSFNCYRLLTKIKFLKKDNAADLIGH
ncbi:MAG: class I SAM-dependent methyltransferase [Oligoflexia bacterium]|nr:class I SAM-dependent methyltransferase [Oligoflexia bacterium]